VEFTLASYRPLGSTPGGRGGPRSSLQESPAFSDAVDAVDGGGIPQTPFALSQIFEEIETTPRT
jgi:hypothetical protein